MEFPWSLQHQSSGQSGRNDQHEDGGIMNQANARRLLGVAGNRESARRVTLKASDLKA